MQQPIYLARSLGAMLTISVFYGAISIAILLLPCWLIYRLALLAVLGLDWTRVLRLYAAFSSKKAVRCLQDDCGKWLLQFGNGRRYKATLCRQGSYCNAFLLILRFEYFGGMHKVLIPCDAVSAHNYRFLALKLNSL